MRIEVEQDILYAPWGGWFPHPIHGLSTTPRLATKAEVVKMWEEWQEKGDIAHEEERTRPAPQVV